MLQAILLVVVTPEPSINLLLPSLLSHNIPFLKEWVNVCVGIYRVSSSERTPKGHCSQPDLKSIHQYFWRGLNPQSAMRETLHGLSQRGYYRQYINQRMKIYISFLSCTDYPNTDPPCALNRIHGPIGCQATDQVSVIPRWEWTVGSLHIVTVGL